MNRWIRLASAAAATVVIFATLACGQTTDGPTSTPVSESSPGGIEGIVTDLGGGPVAGMRVGIVGGTAAFPEIAPETDEAGYYQIGGVAPGTFQVAVHDRDGQRVGRGSVHVKSGETGRLNFSLSGAAAEKQTALPPLPVMRLRHAGQVYDGVEGSYCWPHSRTDDGSVVGLCADKIRWDGLSSAIPVEEGSTVTLEVEAEEQAQALSTAFYELDSGTQVKFLELGSGAEVALVVDLPEGVYNVAVFGRWPDGDLTYWFRIEVLPGPSAKSKEPTAEGLCLPDAPLAVLPGDTWTISGPVKVPTGFPSQLAPGASEVSASFVVEAIEVSADLPGRGDASIEKLTVDLRVTNITLDADGNVLTSEDSSGTWSPGSVVNLGPVLTTDWGCHEMAWLEAWSDEGDASVGERTLSSGVTAVVFTVRQPLVVPAQGIDATVERHYGYEKTTGRVVLQETGAVGTMNGSPFNMEMHQELVLGGSTTAPGTGPESCQKYLDLLVSFNEGITEEKAVVTSYQCMSSYVDSTGRHPSASSILPVDSPLNLRLAAETEPMTVDVRLYHGARVSGSFLKWPEELPTGIKPVDSLQPTPSLNFRYLPQQPPGEYSLVVRAAWGGPIVVFYAVSFSLE